MAGRDAERRSTPSEHPTQTGNAGREHSLHPPTAPPLPPQTPRGDGEQDGGWCKDEDSRHPFDRARIDIVAVRALGPMGGAKRATDQEGRDGRAYHSESCFEDGDDPVRLKTA